MHDFFNHLILAVTQKFLRMCRSHVLFCILEKKGQKKGEETVPAILTGTFVFPNGDRYGKCIIQLNNISDITFIN